MCPERLCTSLLLTLDPSHRRFLVSHHFSEPRFVLVPLRVCVRGLASGRPERPECQQTCFILALKTGPKKVLKTWQNMAAIERPRQYLSPRTSGSLFQHFFCPEPVAFRSATQAAAFFLQRFNLWWKPDPNLNNFMSHFVCLGIDDLHN